MRDAWLRSREEDAPSYRSNRRLASSTPHLPSRVRVPILKFHVPTSNSSTLSVGSSSRLQAHTDRERQRRAPTLKCHSFIVIQSDLLFLSRASNNGTLRKVRSGAHHCLAVTYSGRPCDRISYHQRDWRITHQNQLQQRRSGPVNLTSTDTKVRVPSPSCIVWLHGDRLRVISSFLQVRFQADFQSVD